MTGRSVYVVDDAPDLRLLFTMSLKRNGFEVRGQAATGGEAIAGAPGLDPDVVLIDLLLPDMSGLDVVTVLRTSLPSARLIICSGVDEIETIDECLAAGATGYIDKADASDVGAALTRLLDGG